MNASTRRVAASDALGDAVAVADRDDAALGQPAVVGLPGQPDHGRPGEPRQLDRDRADAAGGAGYDDGVAGR